VQGEFVLLLENTPQKTDSTALTLSLDVLLMRFMKHLKLKEAVVEVVELTGLPKNQVYERALALKDNAL
jgi:16S rRNA (cytidine1402-2'-O)-methyltransferase